MMRINIGDIVDVSFVADTTLFSVKVEHRPQDVGDSWTFSKETGELYESILFQKMTLIQKGE